MRYHLCIYESISNIIMLLPKPKPYIRVHAEVNLGKSLVRESMLLAEIQDGT